MWRNSSNPAEGGQKLGVVMEYVDIRNEHILNSSGKAFCVICGMCLWFLFSICELLAPGSSSPLEFFPKVFDGLVAHTLTHWLCAKEKGPSPKHYCQCSTCTKNCAFRSLIRAMTRWAPVPSLVNGALCVSHCHVAFLLSWINAAVLTQLVCLSEMWCPAKNQRPWAKISNLNLAKRLFWVKGRIKLVSQSTTEDLINIIADIVSNVNVIQFHDCLHFSDDSLGRSSKASSIWEVLKWF